MSLPCPPDGRGRVGLLVVITSSGCRWWANDGLWTISDGGGVAAPDLACYSCIASLRPRPGLALIIQVMTVISRCPYPVVYLFPMLGNDNPGNDRDQQAHVPWRLPHPNVWHHGVRGRDWHPDRISGALRPRTGLASRSGSTCPTSAPRHLSVWAGLSASASSWSSYCCISVNMIYQGVYGLVSLLHQYALHIAASTWSSVYGLIHLLLHQDGLQIAAST